MTIVYDDLDINQIEILLINLCAIHRVPGLMHTTIPRRIYEQKRYIREIKDTDAHHVEISSMALEKIDQLPLTKKK